MQRARRREQISALPVTALPGWLADWQGVGGAATLEEALEPLLGLPLPVATVEQSVLPARLADYRPMMLDALLTSGAVQFRGCGPRLVTFVPAGDNALFGSEPQDRPPAQLHVDATGARASFEQLVNADGRDQEPALVAEALWHDLFADHLQGDSWAAVRRGLELDFGLPAGGPTGSTSTTRSARRRRINTRVMGYPGTFWRTPAIRSR